MQQLTALLDSLDGKPFKNYQRLAGKSFSSNQYTMRFVHIQGSPGAFPASVCHLVIGQSDLGIPNGCLSNKARRTATADYLLRAFSRAVGMHARQNRGALGSGSFQPLDLPPQVLIRNLVTFKDANVRIAYRISLPGASDNRILGKQAALMYTKETPDIIQALKQAVAQIDRLKEHCDTIEDMLDLQNRLQDHGLVGFIADNAILPRESGISEAPLKKDAVAFQTPKALAVNVVLPNAGPISGLGIRSGVTVIIGSGFHGKSTVLNALSKAIYPHIPGDGRERVATHNEAVFICSEAGRAVNGLDISCFISHLPGRMDPERFCTKNASGSTSQAAGIVEAVHAGAKLLLMDEDSSATNLLIRDRQMRKLIPEDPITPFFDRVQELHKNFGVSTLIVAGASSDYLGVADHVIAMREYRPVCMTGTANQLDLPKPVHPSIPLALADNRTLLPGNFDPSFQARRLDKTISVRIKPLRLHTKLLEYGNQQLDLTKLTALVDPHQVLTLGYALRLAGNRFNDASLSPSALADALHRLLEAEGLEILYQSENRPLFLAHPRKLELAGAINRLRNLRISVPEK